MTGGRPAVERRESARLEYRRGGGGRGERTGAGERQGGRCDTERRPSPPTAVRPSVRPSVERASAAATMPSIFGYWTIRGLGQASRLILEYTGEEYEDVRFDAVSSSGTGPHLAPMDLVPARQGWTAAKVAARWGGEMTLSPGVHIVSVPLLL